MLLKAFDEVAEHFVTWDWELALGVAVALGAARGARFFRRDASASELELVATVPPTHPHLNACEHTDARRDDPFSNHGDGAATADHPRPGEPVTWWRLPIHDGPELVGVLYLEYGHVGRPSQRAEPHLDQWARLAAFALRNPTSFRATVP